MSDAITVRICDVCGSRFRVGETDESICDCCQRHGDGFPPAWPPGTCPRNLDPRPVGCGCITGGFPPESGNA
jgi:hypothetical protein